MAAKIKNTGQDSPHYRWLTFSRIVAAVVGGYAFSNVAALVLTYSLPLPQKEALMLASMLSYIIYALAIMWVFSVASVKRAWIGMVISTVLLGVLAFALHSFQS